MSQIVEVYTTAKGEMTEAYGMAYNVFRIGENGAVILSILGLLRLPSIRAGLCVHVYVEYCL